MVTALITLIGYTNKNNTLLRTNRTMTGTITLTIFLFSFPFLSCHSHVWNKKVSNESIQIYQLLEVMSGLIHDMYKCL